MEPEALEVRTYGWQQLIAPELRRDTVIDLDKYLTDRFLREMQRTGWTPLPGTIRIDWSWQEELGTPDDEDWQSALWLARLQCRAINGQPLRQGPSLRRLRQEEGP